MNMPGKPVVTPFFHRASNTWSYVVRDPASTAAAIIDAVLDFDAPSGRTSTTSAQAVVDHVAAEGLDVRWLLETHAHADHLSAEHWLKETHYPTATLAIGEGIRAVQKAFRPIFNLGEHFPVDGSQFDHLFTDDETFDLGGLRARVIAVPGHTSDSNAYLIADALFTAWPVALVDEFQDTDGVQFGILDAIYRNADGSPRGRIPESCRRRSRPSRSWSVMSGRRRPSR